VMLHAVSSAHADPAELARSCPAACHADGCAGSSPEFSAYQLGIFGGKGRNRFGGGRARVSPRLAPLDVKDAEIPRENLGRWRVALRSAKFHSRCSAKQVISRRKSGQRWALVNFLPMPHDKWLSQQMEPSDKELRATAGSRWEFSSGADPCAGKSTGIHKGGCHQENICPSISKRSSSRP